MPALDPKVGQDYLKTRRLVLPDDIQFWGNQMKEHALFLHLMLEQATLKKQALQLLRRWQAVMGGWDKNLMGALDELMAFKIEILNRQKKKEWLGWVLPAFVEHILFEAQYFKARLAQSVTAQQDLTSMIRIVKEHALVAPKLLNPGQPQAEVAASTIATKLATLQSACSAQFGGACNSRHADLAMADDFFRNKAPATLNIVHPVLLAHIIREGKRAQQIASLV